MEDKTLISFELSSGKPIFMEIPDDKLDELFIAHEEQRTICIEDIGFSIDMSNVIAMWIEEGFNDR